MVWELVGDPDEKAWYNHVLSSVCYVHEIEPLEYRSKPVNHKPKHIFQSFFSLLGCLSQWWKTYQHWQSSLCHDCHNHAVMLELLPCDSDKLLFVHFIWKYWSSVLRGIQLPVMKTFRELSPYCSVLFMKRTMGISNVLSFCESHHLGSLKSSDYLVFSCTPFISLSFCVPSVTLITSAPSLVC